MSCLFGPVARRDRRREASSLCGAALLEYAPENPASLDAIEAHDAPHFSGVVDWTAVMDAVEDPDLFEEWRPEQGIFGGARRYVPPPPKGCTRDDAIN